jgi:hypothetical protein
METNPSTPFHEHIQSWLNNTVMTRFRCNPLSSGWAESVESVTAPESGYDSLKSTRIFASDRSVVVLLYHTTTNTATATTTATTKLLLVLPVFQALLLLLSMLVSMIAHSL